MTFEEFTRTAIVATPNSVKIRLNSDRADTLSARAKLGLYRGMEITNLAYWLNGQRISARAAELLLERFETLN